MQSKKTGIYSCISNLMKILHPYFVLETFVLILPDPITSSSNFTLIVYGNCKFFFGDLVVRILPIICLKLLFVKAECLKRVLIGIHLVKEAVIKKALLGQ